MRAIQFWILLLGSLAIAGLQIKAVYLTRSLTAEQNMVEDSKTTASTQPAYENAWKQLSLHIYQASATDPALAKILKDQKIQITARPATESELPPNATALPPSTIMPTTNAAALPTPVPVTTKQQVGPMHP